VFGQRHSQRRLLVVQQSETAESSPRPQDSSNRVMAWLPSLARAALACITTLSSMYCLLAYIPVTYFAFIQAPFQGWMPAFARLQSFLFAAAFVGAAVALMAEHRNSTARRLVWEFIVIGTGMSLYLFRARPLQRSGNSSASFIWAIAFLMPLICMGAIEYRARLHEIPGSNDRNPRVSWIGVLAAAAFVGVMSPATSFLRYWIGGTMPSLSAVDVAAWFWAASTHILLFLVVFCAMDLTARLADRSEDPVRARLVGFTWFWWLVVSFAIYKVVLASIPFQTTEAQIYAAALGLAGVVFAGGWRLRFRTRRRNIRAAWTGAMRCSGRNSLAAFMVFIIAAAVVVPALIGSLDWNSVFEKTWSMAYWGIVAGGLAFRVGEGRRSWPAWAVIAMVAASLLVYRFGLNAEAAWTARLLPSSMKMAASLNRHKEFDPSFAAAASLLTPSTEQYCNPQCRFVREQTNIPASASLNLREINLVENLSVATGKKPNIFIIVVDSLRQDYISAYNPAVTFTPAIGAFAKDSVVFRNAFTRYSGTTLAEPSIWSGTLQLHKHFVQPFQLVNNLEKLTQVDGYQSFVTVDTVLSVLLKPQADLVKLDEGAGKWNDVDFCSTVQDAVVKIDAQHVPGKPIFLYTQPQNIHLLTLIKTAPLRPATKPYPGFARQYASELERVDGCFGSFIEALKERRLYDDSLIILTSDHGEDLQGAGAQIHGFTLKPEVMRIPLIVHVPPRLLRNSYYDPNAIAFNTDITPMLYELLGHGPVMPKPEFGRPLFTRTAEEMEKYRHDSYLVASSYLPLYGLIYGKGEDVFVENEHSCTEEWLHDTDIGRGVVGVLTAEQRRKGQAEIRANLQAIAQLYGYQYKPPTFLDWLMH
jgi:hypothetical protein